MKIGRRDFIRSTLAAGATLILPAHSIAEALRLVEEERHAGLHGYDPPLTEEKVRRILACYPWRHGRLIMSPGAINDYLSFTEADRRYRVAEHQVGQIPRIEDLGPCETHALVCDRGWWFVSQDTRLPNGYVRVDPDPDEIGLAV